MDLIRSNKKGLRHRWFCSCQCFKIWPDCLNFKHWPIFTVKSTLNYTSVLRPSTKKKKEANNKTQIRRRCMRHLIRTYTVWESIYIKSGTDKLCWSKQKKKRKKTGAFKRCILLLLSVKAIFDLLDMPTAPDVLQSQCIHTCRTKGLIIRLPLLMICVNRLFTAQRTVEC